ncbi:MAG: single-stranded DNA-binding protein [Phycisphaeraceae bacterium]|nr:single-stranded DNA-binding protein [Phycisphaeraceae bacterium]
MPNLNKVMLMGNMTRDPELRYLPSNTAVVSFGLAITRRWRNQQGETQEETTFVDCDAFGRSAETINQYLRKGRPVFIEGRLRLDQWTDREGNNRSKLKVVVEQFQFVDSRAPGAASGDSAAPSANGAARPARAPAPGGAAANAGSSAPPLEPHQPVEEDDIPF